MCFPFCQPPIERLHIGRHDRRKKMKKRTCDNHFKATWSDDNTKAKITQNKNWKNNNEKCCSNRFQRLRRSIEHDSFFSNFSYLRNPWVVCKLSCGEPLMLKDMRKLSCTVWKMFEIPLLIFLCIILILQAWGGGQEMTQAASLFAWNGN